MALGRFDQYMYPFYQADIESGEITREEAGELIACMWFKVNEPKMRTVQHMTIGGVTPEGEDACNELTLLMLEVCADVKQPYPNTSLRVNSRLSPGIMERLINCIRVGSGQPMLLNDDTWIPNLEHLGYPAEDARDYFSQGCIEVMIPGKTPTWAPAPRKISRGWLSMGPKSVRAPSPRKISGGITSDLTPYA